MKKIIVYAVVITIILVHLPQAKANGEDLIKKTTGVIFGNVFGPPIGSVRGFASGLVNGTKITAQALGNEEGTSERVLGLISGGLIRGSVGFIIGFVKGVRDATKYGLSDPLTKENFSLAGEKFYDYDPFDWE